MVSLKDFFCRDNGTGKGISFKNNLIKRKIVAYMAAEGRCTIADLTRELNISIPTITKLIHELEEDNIVVDNGKVETAGGRRPNIYGLANSTIYFAGVEVARDKMYFVVTDLHNNMICSAVEDDFTLEDNDETLEKICATIVRFLSGCAVDKNKIIGLGVCITGRVNPVTGRSYKYFAHKEKPLCQIIEECVGIHVLLENDTRACCYAEYVTGNMQGEKNVIYMHMGRGVAIGIIVDGKLYYGHNGFAGEFGHTPFFDNDIICACGKKGCLETEVSGIAIEDQLAEMIENGVNTALAEQYRQGKKIHIDDIVEAARNDDNLCIELLATAAEKIGKSIAYLINIFNQEVVIIGGNLSYAGDYVMLPMKASTHKYSLSLVYKDTEFRPASMKHDAGAMGAAMLIRNTIIEI